MDNFVIGVEGGGSKTKTSFINKNKLENLIKKEGKNLNSFLSEFLISEFVNGPTNPNSVGNDASKKNLLEGIEKVIIDASEKLKIDKNKICEKIFGIGLGMSGVDREEDKIKVLSWIETHEYFINLKNKPKIRIENDSVVGLYSGTLGSHKIEKYFDKPTFVMISGTGCITTGCITSKVNENVVEKWFRSAGWGPLLGDKGNGYWIGSEILNSAVMTQDKVKELNGKKVYSEYVLEAVKTKKKFKSISELIGHVYIPEQGVVFNRMADFAPICFDGAKQGDEICLNILHESSIYLCNYIEGLFNQMKDLIKVDEDKKKNEIIIVLNGSILIHDDGEGIIAKDLKKRICEKYENFEIKFELPKIEPSIASALII